MGFFVVISILIGVVLVAGGVVFVLKDDTFCTPGENCVGIVLVVVIAAILSPVFGLLIAIPIAGFTGGAGCDWKVGVVVGTVVKAEVEGQIFNTYEGLIVLDKDGAGHTFKISDHDMYPYLGMDVEVRYMSCYLPNWRRGNSRNYVIGVTALEKQCATETTFSY